jgi:glycosyltransferase involved in cell wall biosynthesis
MTGALAGLRIVVSGFELEQSEHRGTAVFTKNVLRALRRAGAEIWLLTEYDPPTESIRPRKLGLPSAQMIYKARVLESLNSGGANFVSSLRVRLLGHLFPFRRWPRLLHPLRELSILLFPRQRYRQRGLKAFSTSELFDNPYLQSDRLGYLTDVDGLLCADQIFANSFRLARTRWGLNRLHLDLNGFDGFITTSPLNIEARNTRFCVQTVHDLIPLEYTQTFDSLRAFTRRLLACRQAARLFVSESAERKYNSVFPATSQQKDHASAVIVQSPSLHFPPDACDWEARIKVLRLQAEGYQKLQALHPCRYLLFNSSIEPRKNLLFVLKAYLESGLEAHGIQLCITGKLKNDGYSNEVRRLADCHPFILLTGYVDEALKRQLFLNALALVSPSLVEGFGIPVLDAACLGVPAIASQSQSHREIQQLHDFDQHVLLCSTRETSDWASALRLTYRRFEQQRLEAIGNTARLPHQTQRQLLWFNEVRQQRIVRYRRLQTAIDSRFEAAISAVITAELQPAATTLDLKNTVLAA